MPLKAKFTLFFIVLVGVLTSAFSFLVYQQVETHLVTQAKRNLNRFLEHEIQHWENDQANGWTTQAKNSYLVVEKNGKIVFDSRPEEQSLEFQTKSISKPLGRDQYVYTAFYDTDDLHSFLETLRTLFLVVGGVMLLVTAPLAYSAAWMLLFPFRVLAEATTGFSAYNLSHRLTTPKHLDEYGLLVRSFNNLFERLHTSFGELQRYAQNVSHEFRTPLSVIAAQAENALRKGVDSNNGQVALGKILQQARQLDGMASHLLALGDIRRWAQDETNITPIDVIEISREIALSVKRKPWASEKTVTVGAGPEPLPPEIRIHEEIFITVVSNVLENAFYFAKSKVEVLVERLDGYLEISIHDDGPGLTAEAESKIFEPFFTLREGGHGLGLTIVKAAVEAARGKIETGRSSHLGGLVFRVLFPLFRK